MAFPGSGAPAPACTLMPGLVSIRINQSKDTTLFKGAKNTFMELITVHLFIQIRFLKQFLKDISSLEYLCDWESVPFFGTEA